MGQHALFSRFAQGRPEISSDEDALALLLQHLADQGHRRALSIRPGERQYRGRQESRGEFKLADDFHASTADPLKRFHSIGDTGADHHEIGMVERRFIPAADGDPDLRLIETLEHRG